MQKFDHHWRRAINIPAWVIQLLVCIFLIGVSAVALAATNSDEVKDAASQYQNGSLIMTALS